MLTDSTASLGELAGSTHNLEVIPLHITVADSTYREGQDIDQAAVVEMVSRGVQVSTSQPNLDEFHSVMARAFDRGYTDIVAVHLSAKLSGTFGTAVQAAANWPGRVHVIDSQAAGLGLGVAALAGARAAGRGQGAHAVAEVITAHTARAGALFMVDSLDHLSRGGRLSTPAAAVGTALGLKPILALVDGEIQIAAKLRSRGAALAQMFSQAVSASDLDQVEFGVHYFGAQTFAAKLALQIEQTFGRPVYLTQASAVLGAHVGPGLVALTYA